MASTLSRVLPLCDTVYVLYLKIPPFCTLLVHIRIALKVSQHEIKCYEGGHFTLEGDSLP